MARPPTVTEYMDRLEHPLRDVVDALRALIHDVDPAITEEIKWNAPSFSYKGYLVTFNLHRPEEVLLVFHDGAILDPQDGLLEGSYPDRRLVHVRSLADVEAMRPRLQAAIREWIAIRDAATP